MNHFLAPLILISVLAIDHSAVAQLRVGIKAGANLSTIQPSTSKDSPLISYQGGLVSDIALSSHFSIQPAALLSTKGTKSRFDPLDPNDPLIKSDYYFMTKITYLEVPVLALYKQKLGNAVKIYGGIGPYLGIGLAGRFKTKNSDGLKIVFSDTQNERFPTIKPLDFGASAAVGVEVGNFLAGFNYNRAISSQVISARNYNSTFGFTAGYLFGSGSK